jgi:hypothetical protein
MKMLRKFLLALALLVASGAQAATRPIDLPIIEVAPGATYADVQRAILSGGVGKDWKLSGSQPGVIFLTCAKDGSSVTVAVAYTIQKVFIFYWDSANFDYGKNEDGEPVIDSRYNSLMRYLFRDIKQQFNDLSDDLLDQSDLSNDKARKSGP